MRRYKSTSGTSGLTQGQLLLTVIVGAAVVMAMWIFVFAPMQGGQTIVVGPGGTTTTITQPGGTTPGGFVSYDVAFTYGETNAVGGGALTTASATYNVFHSGGVPLSQVTTLFGIGSQAIAAGTTATRISMQEADNDFLYINLDLGTTDYPDPASILAANSDISMAKWLPVTSRNVPELVVQYNVPNPNWNADPEVSAQLLIRGIPDDTGVTLSAPADQDSLGTTANTDAYITWTASALAANNAWAFANIKITSNQTTQYMSVMDIEVDTSSYIVDMKSFTNIGDNVYYTSPAKVTGTAGGVDQQWQFFPRDSSISRASDFASTILVPRSSSHADQISITAHVRLSFAAAANGVTCVLSVEVIDASNGIQTAVTDSVALGG